jgi:type II secretory pathway pseudopilin PulG
MSMRSSSNPIRQNGYGLLVLAILLIVLGLAAAVILALLPNRADQDQLEKTIALVEESQELILGFVVENYRLPDPDSNDDGLENNGSASGALPYRSMGLPARLLDEASIPLRYAPYRNAPANIDLADAVALYAPDLPDLSGLQDLVIAPAPGVINVTLQPIRPFVPTIDLCAAQFTPSPVNLLDFCVALDNAVAAVATASAVNIGPGNTNVAYAVVSGGLEDADGNGLDRSLDGLNDDGNLSFEDPARGRGTGYDDIVRGLPFSSLQRELSCRALVDSVDLLASVAQASKAVMENVISAYNTAEVSYLMAEITVLMDVVAIAQTVQAAIGVAADIAKSGGGCASVILSAVCCPALAGNIARAVVYAVTAAVQIAVLAIDIDVRNDARDTRDLYRDVILPGANAHLCSAIAEVTAADARGGLSPTPQP